MHKRLTAALVTGAIAAGGLGVGLVALPVIASAATTTSPTAEAAEDAVDAVGDRLGRIRDALDGLVSDGTLDQAQADAVAETLDEALPEREPGGLVGPGGHGGHGGPGDGPGGLALGTAADLLGLTPAELVRQLRAGESLAAVAQAQGVAEATLVDGLVSAAEEHVAERLAAGDLTQGQADQRLAGLEERITVLVGREDLPLHDGHRAGTRGGAPEASDDATDDGTPAPSGTATTGSTGLTA